MTVIAERVTLPLVAVDQLWTALNPGTPHPALGIGDFYIDEDNRERVTEAINEALQEQSLGTLSEPSAELAGTLRLIATATEEYYAWINDIPSADAGAVLASARDGEAVLVSRDQRIIALEPIGAGNLAETFISAFTEVKAAEIPNLSVPKASFTAEDPADQGGEEDFTFAYDEGDADDPAAKLRELVQAKRQAVYQMYTARRAGGPSRKRVGPYSMIDIVDHGRVLTFVKEAGPEPTIECLPGSKDNLVKALTEANAALA